MRLKGKAKNETGRKTLIFGLSFPKTMKIYEIVFF